LAGRVAAGDEIVWRLAAARHGDRQARRMIGHNLLGQRLQVIQKSVRRSIL
jgi:hypothetical protein